MATSTPWGPSQESFEFGSGITFHQTANIGGYHVAPKLNAKVPPALRIASGWYEKHPDAARVVLAFPQRFNPHDVEQAKVTLRRWCPDAYEAFYGERIAPGESYIKDERRAQIVPKKPTVNRHPSGMFLIKTTGRTI